MGHSDSSNPHTILSNQNRQKTPEKHEDTPDCDSAEIIDEKKNKCTYDGCGASFRKPSRLQWHIRQHTGERPYKCTFKDCEKAYTTSSHLKRHVQSHQSFSASFVCSICSLTMKYRQNLLRHHQRMHTDNGRLSCHKCGAKFRKKYKLEEHLAAHDGIYHSCSKCRGKFTSSYLLEKHMQTSHKNKTHTCTTKGCDKIFNTWKEMGIHKKNDHVKEYKCTKCEKVFMSKIHVKLHIQSHTEENFLACPYEKCPKFYLYQKNLDVHIRAKHLNIKVTCDVCKSGFSSKSVLRNHIEKVHQSTVKSRNTRKGNRKRRKDAGTRSRSILAKLVGLELPIHVEKQLIARKTKVDSADTLFIPPVLNV